jgi:hypothetical protein
MQFPMSPEEAHVALEQARMSAALQVHTFNELLDAASEDQLRAVASIFEGCMQSKRVAPQIYGQITAILRLKHNSCQCGQDHAAEFDVDRVIEKFTGAPAVAVAEPAIAGKEEVVALRTLILDLRDDVKTLGMTAAPSAQLTFRHAQELLDKMATMTLPVEITCNCDGGWHGGEHVSNCPRYVDTTVDPNEKLI